MSLRRVLLDVDGVIADFDTYAQLIIFQLFGRQPIKDRKYWAIEKNFSLKNSQRDQFWKMLDLKGVAQQLQPYPGAIEGVKEIASIADVYFVTSPIQSSPTWCYDRSKWLKKHFGTELGRKVVLTGQKHICAGDFFVDDKVTHVTKWQQHNPLGTGFLWNQPYNLNEDPSIPRLGDWRTLLLYVSGQTPLFRPTSLPSPSV